MIEENTIVVAKNGIRLNHSGSEITRLVDRAFPVDEDDIYDGLWFFFPEVPAGIGRVGQNGYIDWV
jgi:hypothetical protein